jgi:hypothetical protein
MLFNRLKYKKYFILMYFYFNITFNSKKSKNILIFELKQKIKNY